jgi:hypothetical protein
MVKLFCWIIKPYPLDKVIWGLGQYIANNADMPTPSDIVEIIDPQPAPWRPDKSYYIKLQEIHKQHGPYGLNIDEIEYIAKYEAHMQQEMKSAH